MRYDSSPPAFYDSLTGFYDELDPPLTFERTPLKYATLKLSGKTLDQKLDLTVDLAAALGTNIAVYATPNPSTVTLTGKVTAIRAKQLEISAAQTVLDTKMGELDTLAVDLENALVDETSYIQTTSHGVEATIRLLGVDVRSTPLPLAAPEKLQNFRLSPGKNPGAHWWTG